MSGLQPFDASGYHSGRAEMDVGIPQSQDVLDHNGSPILENLHHHDGNGILFGHQNGAQQGRDLPLKTPDKRLLTSDNTSLEVRKRLCSSYPDRVRPSDSNDGKRRHVAKSLFGTSSEENINRVKAATVKCFFGAPSQDENNQVRKEYEERTLKQYETFMQRYEIIEEIKKF